jgi:ABC-2 type transport system ATP-binding protein
MKAAALASGEAPAAASGPAIRIQDLARRFEKRDALGGVSFEVAPGERIALLGPNGSGKSTLLRILATLLRPNGGHAEVAGNDVAREPAAVRRRLGTVFQSPSLDPKLSVRENLDLQGNLYGLHGSVLSGRVAEMLERFDLATRQKDRVETLSGGMKRRVELAKTLLHRPDVLLLDEPSTGLDPAARLEFWSTLLALQTEQGLTLVVATHLMDEADRCHRVALLDQGKLVAIDTPDALKARVGGPVVDVETADPDALASQISGRLGIKARRVGGMLRIENAGGFDTAQRLQQAFPRDIRAVRIGQPSLEDVFLALTGNPLSSPEAP